MKGLAPVFVLAFVLLPVTLYVHARLDSPGLSTMAASVAQLAATALFLFGLMFIVWDGYHDTGTEPKETLDEAFTTLTAGALLTGWVWLKMLRHEFAAAVAAGCAAAAMIVAAVTWFE